MNKIIDYIVNFIKYFFDFRVSFLSIIRGKCMIDTTAVIYSFTKIVDSSIGRYSYIAHNTIICKTNIGNFTSIGNNVYIGLPKHPIHFKSTSPIFTSKKNALKTKWSKINCFEEFGQIEIGNDVWIGNNVLIISPKQGQILKIGDGAVIGAGSIVTKDIEPYTINVGSPCQAKKKRFSDDVIRKLQKEKWWEKSDYYLIQNIDKFQRNLDIENTHF